jgi:hypothetical protein
MALLKTNPTLSLEQRIKQTQAEAEAAIDEAAAELKRRFPGLPLTTLRRDIEARAFGCVCKQALSLMETKS